jgi:hypothetical protein
LEWKKKFDAEILELKKKSKATIDEEYWAKLSGK